MTIHLEVMGAPGSGKSSLQQGLRGSASVLSEEAALLRLVRDRLELPLRALARVLPRKSLLRGALPLFRHSHLYHEALCRFLADHGECLTAFFESQARAAMRREERERVIRFFLDAAAAATCILQDSDARAVLLDEGFMQRSGTLLLTPSGDQTLNDDLALRRYLDHAPTPELTVLIEADLDASLERLQGRPAKVPWRMRSLSQPEMRRYLTRVKGHYGALLDLLEERGAQTLRVNNTGSLLEGQRLLASSIEQWLEARPRDAPAAINGAVSLPD